LVPVVGLEPTT